MFAGSAPASRIVTFSCGHIVPPDALACFTVAAGPTHVPFNFRHGARSGAALMTELGRALVSIAAVIPAGIVVFLPSYEYLRVLLAHLSQPGAAPPAGSEGGGGGSAFAAAALAAALPPSFPVKPALSSMLARLALKKRLFCEPKQASEVDTVWGGYAAAARAPPPPEMESGSSGNSSSSSSSAPRGALLFAVVGGKMSEGINFSDDLARGVVMVGMPYGNPADPELRERMAYLDRRGAAAVVAASHAGGSGSGSGGGSGAHAASSPGREYYENLCLRAVNQSIGRSIRHAGDHAVILLLDQRYSAPAVRAKLPGWIGDRVSVQEAWGPVVGGVGNFFRAKRKGGEGGGGRT